MSTSFIVVAKRDCPTCDLVQPVLRRIASSGAGLTVYTQDDPTFPDGMDAIDDRSLEHSWRLAVETVPTLIRLEGGAETERTVGWDRAEWTRVTGLDPLGADLPGLPAGLRLEERGPRHAGDPGGCVRGAAPEGARH